MGNAFSGNHECDGNSIVGAPNVATPKGTAGNSGTNFPTANNPAVNQGSINLSSVKFTPNTTVNLPNLSNYTVLAENYYKGTMNVNNMNVNNSINIIPRGIIIAFNGSEIPYGWALCDGTNGTPDLRGRFIYGFDSKKNSNKLFQYGGEENHALNIAEIPPHAHSYAQNSGPGGFLTGATAAGKGYASGMTPGTAGDFTYLNVSKGLPHNNMPPFYVIAYIMKL